MIARWATTAEKIVIVQGEIWSAYTVEMCLRPEMIYMTITVFQRASTVATDMPLLGKQAFSDGSHRSSRQALIGWLPISALFTKPRDELRRRQHLV
ncbi:hypothetical protein ASD36_26390 [Rhizobium sp. Root1334]|nr:hypothetical protein ASD36_26390 [Rhizobium sp. Root1334]